MPPAHPLPPTPPKQHASLLQRDAAFVLELHALSTKGAVYVTLSLVLYVYVRAHTCIYT